MNHNNLSLVTYGFALVFLMNGCAPSRPDSLSQLLDEGRYDEMIGRIADSSHTATGSIDEIKLLGIAYVQKKKFPLADSLLTQYLNLVPDDDQAMYYRAVCSDSLDDELQAIEWYRRYAASTSLRDLAAVATARSGELVRRRMRKDVHTSLFYESSITGASLDRTAVAVLSFENNGSDRTLDPLCRGLAEMVTTDLSKVRALKVVERLRLQTMLEELQFGETDLAAPETVPRIGRLVGAHRIVKGSFASTADGMLHIDASVTTTTDANIEAFDSILGPKENIFRAEKDLVLRLLGSLSIPLSPEEREAILTIPTENFFAFLRYAEGLEYADRGLFAEAALSFKAAVDLDPHFTDARDQLDYTEALTPGSGAAGAGAQLPTVTGGIVPQTTTESDAISTIIERGATTLTHTGGYTPGLPNPGQTNPGKQDPLRVRQPLREPPKPVISH